MGNSADSDQTDPQIRGLALNCFTDLCPKLKKIAQTMYFFGVFSFFFPYLFNTYQYLHPYSMFMLFSKL